VALVLGIAGHCRYAAGRRDHSAPVTRHEASHPLLDMFESVAAHLIGLLPGSERSGGIFSDLA
jgi:hypothetical protein